MDNGGYNGFDPVSNEKYKPESKYTSYKRQQYSSETGTWKDLDSTVCFYDEQMNLSMTLMFKYENGWKKNAKREYKYDAAGYPLACITHKWDNESRIWNLVGEKDYTIDTITRKIVIENKYHNFNDPDWQYAPKHTYLCDANGNDTLHLSAKWDKDANEYIDDNREYRHYDVSGHLVYSNIQNVEKKDKAWHDSWVKKYSYDANGNEIMGIEQSMDNGKSSMSFVDSTFFDQQNRPLEERFYVNNHKDSTTWLEYLHKFYYTNPDNNKDYIEIQWRQGKPADTLMLWSKETKEYDSQNNLINRYLMNPTQREGWRVQFHDSCVYDRSDNIIYRLDQQYRQMPQGDNGTQIFYYYLPYTIAGIEGEEGESSATLYPNPSKGKETYLKYNAQDNSSMEIKVIDQSGRTVSSETREISAGENNLLISHPELSAGAYHVDVTDLHSGAQSSFKWVIE
jgi:hypothetical protein